ncbi:MAG: hypothetical protein OEV21_06645, partial [Thermoplasmata archaeon]|nr:hypothetical protein [Thermoplasmata archaeon]
MGVDGMRSLSSLIIAMILLVSLLSPVVALQFSAESIEEIGDDRSRNPNTDFMRYIHINEYRFDPLLDKLEIPEGLSYGKDPLAHTSYFIVQFNGPIYPQMKESLGAEGAEILYYINYNAFVIKATGPSLKKIETLQDVRWVV